MIVPRKLIDNNYLYNEYWSIEIHQNLNSFEHKLYCVLAKSYKFFQVSPQQTTNAFIDAYYIVTLCLMRPSPEYWCDDFFEYSGIIEKGKGEFVFEKERQLGIMSIVYCVLCCCYDLKEHIALLREQISSELRERKALAVANKMLHETKNHYKIPQKLFLPKDLCSSSDFFNINWNDYINPFDKTGQHVSCDLEQLLTIIGSGLPIKDCNINEGNNYNKVRGKVARILLVDALKKFYAREKEESYKSKSRKNYDLLLQTLDDYYEELKDWIDGVPPLDEYDVSGGIDLNDTDDRPEELEYLRPLWLDDSSNWPSLTKDAFIFFTAHDMKRFWVNEKKFIDRQKILKEERRNGKNKEEIRKVSEVIKNMLNKNSLVELMNKPCSSKTWRDKFINNLMREFGENIANGWNGEGKKNIRSKIKGWLLGDMKRAGLIDGTNAKLASLIYCDQNESETRDTVPSTSLEIYMGPSQGSPYTEWVKAYINNSAQVNNSI